MEVVASPEQMDASASNIENKTEEINAHLEAIKSHIGSIGENWKDESGKTFLDKFNELQSSMPAYLNKAHACAAFMKGVSNAYREVAVINQRAVNGSDIK